MVKKEAEGGVKKRGNIDSGGNVNLNINNKL